VPVAANETAAPTAPAAVPPAPAAAPAPVPSHPLQAATEVPAPQPAMPAAAAESLALASPAPRDPVQPYTSTFKPARNMSAPGKFINTDPGGWPPVVGVPVPAAGGIGVSPMVPARQRADGRFQ